MTNVVARNEYQAKRLASLEARLSLDTLEGLEIGACDKPTVPSERRECRFADFRSAEEMVALWNLSSEAVCDIAYILDRKKCISQQIDDRFDYIIACHVIEHISDPIGYLHGLSKLLKPKGLIMLTVPDKRCTFDVHRPLSKIDHLLMHFHEQTRYPSLEHIIEFHRYAVEHESGRKVDLAEAYNHAISNYESGEADAHCNVWDDATFRDQFQTLSDINLLGDLVMTAFEPTPEGFNEFTVFFEKR